MAYNPVQLISHLGSLLVVNADRVGYVSQDRNNPETHSWVFIGEKSVQVQMPQDEVLRVLAQASVNFRSVDSGPLEHCVTQAQIAEAVLPQDVSITGLSSGDIHFNGPVSIKVNTDA